MKAVLFTRAHLMYQRGEIAGFPEDHAQKLIAAGIARDPEAPLPEGNVLPKGTGAAPPVLPQGVDLVSDHSRQDGGTKASGGQAGAGAADQPDTKPTSAKADPASDPGTKADSDTGAKTDPDTSKPAPGAPPAQGKRR